MLDFCTVRDRRIAALNMSRIHENIDLPRVLLGLIS